MYIKVDNDSFKTLLRLLKPQEMERLARLYFKVGNLNEAGVHFALADVGLKVAKGILGAKKKITITETEACYMLDWSAKQEKKEEFDFYAQNVVRQVKISLHEQLTNYRNKF